MHNYQIQFELLLLFLKVEVDLRFASLFKDKRDPIC